MRALAPRPARGPERPSRSRAPSGLWASPLAVLLGLTLAVAVAVPVEASSVITRGSSAKPWVALTFDDGWSADRCERIVRTLRAKGAPATFFINGAIMNQAPARWRAMLAGFEVANHTRTHKDLARLGTAAIRWEIASNEALVERILRRPMLKVMRPPYGSYNSRVLQVASALGYRTVLWSNDSYDTRSWATTSSVIRYGSAGGKGAIVLLHCGPSMTPAAVGPIIDRYRARGFRLVELGELLGGSPSAPPTACRVRNLGTGAVHPSLQKAARAASAGDRLTVQGTCTGSTTLRKDLRIKGTRTASSGPPVLSGGKSGRVLTVAPGVSVTIRGLVIRWGATDGAGGGVLNRGTLNLRDVIVRANHAASGGGAHNTAGATLRLNGATVVRRHGRGRRRAQPRDARDERREPRAPKRRRDRGRRVERGDARAGRVRPGPGRERARQRARPVPRGAVRVTATPEASSYSAVPNWRVQTVRPLASRRRTNVDWSVMRPGPRLGSPSAWPGRPRKPPRAKSGRRPRSPCPEG
jgi:peptidoglycan-N-acetylglucosamine deacetylase